MLSWAWILYDLMLWSVQACSFRIRCVAEENLWNWEKKKGEICLHIDTSKNSELSKAEVPKMAGEWMNKTLRSILSNAAQSSLLEQISCRTRFWTKNCAGCRTIARLANKSTIARRIYKLRIVVWFWLYFLRFAFFFVFYFINHHGKGGNEKQNNNRSG